MEKFRAALRPQRWIQGGPVEQDAWEVGQNLPPAASLDREGAKEDYRPNQPGRGISSVLGTEIISGIPRR